MSEANTNVESLENVLRAVIEFQGETETFNRASSVALLEFEEMVREEERRLRELIDEGSHRRDDTGNDELDQMLYEYETSSRRQTAGIDAYYDELSRLYGEYLSCRDVLAGQLSVLMQGETMGGDAHGLREVISLLQDYLGYR